MLIFKRLMLFFGIVRVFLKKILNSIHRAIVFCLLSLIKAYQYFLSPIMSSSCRFYPTCSSYGKEAILTHGVVKGLFLLVLRLLKCNRWFSGGFDPVPPKSARSK